MREEPLSCDLFAHILEILNSVLRLKIIMVKLEEVQGSINIIMKLFMICQNKNS